MNANPPTMPSVAVMIRNRVASAIRCGPVVAELRGGVKEKGVEGPEPSEALSAGAAVGDCTEGVASTSGAEPGDVASSGEVAFEVEVAGGGAAFEVEVAGGEVAFAVEVAGGEVADGVETVGSGS
ncbi:MAG: hypothetical protein OXH53_01620 [bacterium]|nr:hypothetical protein [bacterium]